MKNADTAEIFGCEFNLQYQFSGLSTALNGLENSSDGIERGEFGHWDFRASYAAKENLSVYLDINNPNDESTTAFQSGDERMNTEYETEASTFYLGTTYVV